MERIFGDGKKIERDNWRPEKVPTKVISNADSTLLLPIDVSLMTSWVLMDFEDLK